MKNEGVSRVLRKLSVNELNAFLDYLEELRMDSLVIAEDHMDPSVRLKSASRASAFKDLAVSFKSMSQQSALSRK